MWGKFIESLKEDQYLYQFFTLIFAVLVFFIDKLLEKRKKYQSKITLLKSIEKELELNSQWVNDIVESEDDQINYYNPTNANFKCNNDVLMAYLPNKEGLLNKNIELMNALLIVNYAIGFYNQQVEEQHDFRFSNPHLLGLATSYIWNKPNGLDMLKDWMCCEEKRPEELKYFLTELRLRNWAINKGKREKLKPALFNAINLIKKEINLINSRNFLQHFWHILWQ